MSQILTITELAKLLQMSKSTVYKYAEQGKIPSFKIGTSLRFLENEINDYIKKTIYDQRNTANESLWRF
jgi:PTS system nitrogen regulatory IIA component